jgi:hypothetical protein
LTREKIENKTFVEATNRKEGKNMKCFFAELSIRTKKAIISVFAALLMVFFFAAAGSATVYDNFTDSGIDSSKWIATGTGFSQPGDGYLYYSGTTPANEKIVSTAAFASGVFTLSFADYWSNNDSPAGEGLGSVAALGLGSRSNGAWVRIERGQVLGTTIGQYIEVNWAFQINGDQWSNIYVNYVQSDITSGEFQLRYNGTDVTFFYRTAETDPWTQMVITGQGGQPVLSDGQTQPLIITPGWTAAVPLFIQAIPGGTIGTPYSCALSFKVDNVKTSSRPVLHIINRLQSLVAGINNIEAYRFNNANLQNTLANKLNAVAQLVDQGSYADALNKLQNDILKKTAGCHVTGRPDRNDWIADCDAQDQVYPAIIEIISLMQRLI